MLFIHEQQICIWHVNNKTLTCTDREGPKVVGTFRITFRNQWTQQANQPNRKAQKIREEGMNNDKTTTRYNIKFYFLLNIEHS